MSRLKKKKLKFLQENTEKKLKEGMKPALEKSIFEFFTSLGVRIIRDDGNSNFHHSMLIHTKETKVTMHGILETVRPYVAGCEALFNQNKLRKAEAGIATLRLIQGTKSITILFPYIQ